MRSGGSVIPIYILKKLVSEFLCPLDIQNGGEVVVLRMTNQGFWILFRWYHVKNDQIRTIQGDVWERLKRALRGKFLRC